MVSPSKLYERLLLHPYTTISFREFERLLRAFGFVHKRTKGSHRTYKHSLVPHVLTVQPVGRDAARYQVDRFLELVTEFDLHMPE
ncbi:MAG: type II toxin-antitoxin system HicA family toxin [Pseudomonadota bacterium]|nr:type II toxin-antitoxin system HicA family toxin [Pseudomonadota bacterium]